MLESRVSELVNSLSHWYYDHGTLVTVENLLGCPSDTLVNFLYLNDLCYWNRNPKQDVSFQHLLDCVILWLALRQTVIKKRSYQRWYSPLGKNETFSLT